jgi:hypothetical protein
MSDTERSSDQIEQAGNLPENLGHPRGTLAVVTIFGLLFGLGWLSMYLLLFLKRGALHP